MSAGVNWRGLAGIVVGLAGRLGGGKEKCDGRRDKSAASGLAHVVGLFEHLGHFEDWSRWRLAQNV